MQPQLEQLFHAIRSDSESDAEQVQSLLSQHPELVNARDGHGEYGVFVAIKNRNLDALRLLLEANAPLDVSDRKGEFPFHMATQHAFRESFTLLQKHGADVNQKRRGDQLTPLSLAASFLDKQSTWKLLSLGADASARDARGKRITELIGASSMHREFVEYRQRISAIEKKTGSKISSNQSDCENASAIVEMIESNPRFQPAPEVKEDHFHLGPIRRAKLGVISFGLFVAGIYQVFYGPIVPGIVPWFIALLMTGFGFWLMIICLTRN